MLQGKSDAELVDCWIDGEDWLSKQRPNTAEYRRAERYVANVVAEMVRRAGAA